MKTEFPRSIVAAAVLACLFSSSHLHAAATLKGHWKLDETSGTSAADSSGNANTGTLTGGPTWTSGKILNGLSFDGVDDIVTCGSGASLDNLPSLTVSAWINPTTLGEGGFGRIINKAVGTSVTSGWGRHHDERRRHPRGRQRFQPPTRQRIHGRPHVPRQVG